MHMAVCLVFRHTNPRDCPQLHPLATPPAQRAVRDPQEALAWNAPLAQKCPLEGSRPSAKPGQPNEPQPQSGRGFW
jgi:hypothetical protein